MESLQYDAHYLDYRLQCSSASIKVFFQITENSSFEFKTINYSLSDVGKYSVGETNRKTIMFEYHRIFLHSTIIGLSSVTHL